MTRRRKPRPKSKTHLSRMTKAARRAKLRRKVEAALAGLESSSCTITSEAAWPEFPPTYNSVICEISNIQNISNEMFNEDSALSNTSWTPPDEPLVYSCTPAMPRLKRNVSVEEVVPDDPFAGIKTESEELKIEFEIKKEEPLFEEDNPYDNPIDDFEYEAPESIVNSPRSEGAGGHESTAQMEEETPTHLYLEDFQNAIEQVIENDVSHLKARPSAPAYMCPIKNCGNGFVNERRLRIHLSREHNRYRGSFKYSCRKCAMSYDLKNSLMAHIKRKHGSESIEEDKTELTCDICFSILVGERRMRFHMQRKHQFAAEAFKYKCDKCSFRYDRASSLLAHVRRKHSKRSQKQYNFACPLCTKLFTSRQSYVAHLKRNHKQKARSDEQLENAYDVGDGRFRCPECSMLFTGIDRLRLHMRRKHDALGRMFQYRCPYCILTYDKRESMKKHVQRKHNSRWYCTTCNNQFSSQKAYDDHSHDGPSAEGIHQCPICKMIYMRLGSLRKHITLCHGMISEESDPTSLYCEQCGEGFDSQHHLDVHTRNAHTNASYQCTICDKSFHLRGSLTTHMYRKHKGEKPESEDTVEKTDCSESSGNNEQAMKSKVETDRDKMKDCAESSGHKNPEDIKMEHETLDQDDYDDSFCELEVEVQIESNDTGVKKEEEERHVMKCTECEATFDSWIKVRNHIKKVHIFKESTRRTVRSKDVICQHCGLVCTDTQLNKHMRAEHKDKFNIYKCGQCNYTTFKQDLLFKHESNHNLEKKWVCKFEGCTYRTHNKYHFQKHVAIHTGQSKMKCPLCPYESNDTNLMRNHKYEHDTGKKRYQCDKCDYATNIPACIVSHRNKHSDERNFKCNVCKFTSKYSTSLWLHKKQKHSDNSPLKRKCDVTKRPEETVEEKAEETVNEKVEETVKEKAVETVEEKVEDPFKNEQLDIKIKEDPEAAVI